MAQLVSARLSQQEVPGSILGDFDVCFDFLLIRAAIALNTRKTQHWRGKGGEGRTVGFHWYQSRNWRNYRRKIKWLFLFTRFDIADTRTTMKQNSTFWFVRVSCIKGHICRTHARLYLLLTNLVVKLTSSLTYHQILLFLAQLQHGAGTKINVLARSDDTSRTVTWLFFRYSKLADSFSFSSLLSNLSIDKESNWGHLQIP